MANDEGKLRRIDQHLVFCGLHGHNIGYMIIWDRVAIGLKVDIAIKTTDPEGHFSTVIKMEWQRLQSGLFLFKE